MSLWDEVKKNVVDLYSVTSDKTTEMAKVSSRRWDKFGISRDIERQFSELGNLVYTGLKEEQDDVLGNPEIAVIMSRISALEQELARKEEEIENIHQEHREKKAAEASSGSSAGFSTETEAGADQMEPEQDGEVASEEPPEVVLKDPVLDKGTHESAILVEPEPADEPEVAGEDPVEAEVEAEDSDEDKRSSDSQ